MNHQRTYILYLFLACSLLFLSLPAEAQFKRIKEQKEEMKDSLPLYRGVVVSYDLCSTVMRLVSDYGQFEAAAKVNLKDRYFPTLEIGYGTSNHETDPQTGLHTKTNAPFFRIGMDYNIAKQKHDDYRVFVGARYGFTTFSFEADGVITDPVWGGTTPYKIEQSGCSYHWADLLFGLDAKVVDKLHVGWSLRYRLKLAEKGLENGELWYIPGFGKNGNKIAVSFNVGWEI